MAAAEQGALLTVLLDKVACRARAFPDDGGAGCGERLAILLLAGIAKAEARKPVQFVKGEIERDGVLIVITNAVQGRGGLAFWDTVRRGARRCRCRLDGWLTAGIMCLLRFLCFAVQGGMLLHMLDRPDASGIAGKRGRPGARA